MDATETMLRAVDTMDSTRRNLMGLAELCSTMDTLTHEDVRMTLHSFIAHCAEQMQQPAEDLTQLIAEERKVRIDRV